MSQTFTDDCFAGPHVAQTDMQNIENNFAALKSAFSGATAPSNPIALMLWGDTTANILKMRNEANTAWLNVYDFANQVSYGAKGITITAGTGLSGGGELDQNRTISHDAHTGDVTGTLSLSIGNAKVTQAKLKTSIGSVSNAGNTLTNYILPGGEYGFYPQIKMSNTSAQLWKAKLIDDEDGGCVGWTSYATNIALARTDAGSTIYAQQRYVTSSGEVYWIFILRNKITKAISSVWQSPNHPCFGNSGKPQLVPHPFYGHDESKYEIIVINPSKKQILEMQKKIIVESETKPDRDLIEVILEDYTLNESIEPLWPNRLITVGLPPEWEQKVMGDVITPIKKIIPKPPMIKTARLI